MTQPRTWVFNPRENRKHFCGILLGILSFIGSVVGITFAILEHENSSGGVQGTVVTVGRGYGSSDEYDYQGTIRVIWGFGEENNVLGSSDLDNYIDNPITKDITIQQKIDPKASARYVDLIVGDDEICIDRIETTFPTGNSRTWYGDLGAACGWSWEYGSQAVQLSNGSHFYPKCVWMSTTGVENIEKDAPDSITLKQMKIDMLAYDGETADQINSNKTYYCGATIFSEQDTNPIVGVPDQGPGCENCTHIPSKEPNFHSHGAKRPSPRSQKSAERMVISSRSEHSAVELCESQTSRGSDFVSKPEGMFCDMETKTLHPLCGSRMDGDCFDLDSRELQSRRRDVLALSRMVLREYKSVAEWD